jgi:hypothetical protein
MGFGIPKTVSEILYTDPYESTLILRGTLNKGEFIDIKDFPMPRSIIKDGLYAGHVIATLVYDPILDPSQGTEYCQSNMDIKFGPYDKKTKRDTSKPSIINPVGRQDPKNIFLEATYSKKAMRNNRGEFALKERLLIQCGDKYYPVKKYAVDLSEMTDANKERYATADKPWYLRISGLFREHIEQQPLSENLALSQEFCLIITIRDPERRSQIYNEVVQRLDEFNFWHSGVKLSSDVSVPITSMR